MINYKIEDRTPRHCYSAEVSIYKSKYERVKKLLNICDFNTLTPDEYKNLNIQEDNIEKIYSVEFEDGASLTWDLCSGQHNYYDSITFMHPNGDYEDLDCSFELEDIEIESGPNVYTVKINVKDDPDIRLWDQRFWEPDEILWNTLFKHRGHKVEIATYGDYNNPDDICLECTDCNEVILDAEIYTICAREDGDDECDE